MATAILIDGAYFLKRYRDIYPNWRDHTPQQVAKTLFTWALKHLEDKENKRDLYRIFFYDCPPLLKKAHHPVTHAAIDFSKSKEALFRTALHSELKKLRKLALRLGHLSEQAEWAIKPHKTKALLAGELTIAQLTAEDVSYSVRQKGVDMRIGLDIASLAYKKLADQIVLLAGDADFVPAAKLARREGVDFILDPMWQSIPSGLFEHIDGLHSTCPKPNSTGGETC